MTDIAVPKRVPSALGIVMLVNEFPPVPTGGAEKQAERLALYLAQRGFPVEIITRRVDHLPSQEVYCGVKVVRPLTVGIGKLKTITFLLGSLITLWRDRQDYSILHAHLAFSPALVAVVVAHWLDKRVIVKLGNSGEFGDIQTSQRTWRGKLRLALLRRWANMIIVLDDDIRREALLAGFPAERIRIMSNGIDSSAFVPTQTRDIWKTRMRFENKVVLLFIGRLTAQKSLSTLLEAFACAVPHNPGLYLVVVGDGPQRKILESQAHRLNLASQVVFAGNQPDVLPYLHAADIFVLPSLTEGISNALLEAMAAKLACIVTSVGANVEILDHGRCGVLLPVGDVSALTDAIVRLSNDSEQRRIFGESAYQRVFDRYDFRVIGAEYEKLYEGLIS